MTPAETERYAELVWLEVMTHLDQLVELQAAELIAEIRAGVDRIEASDPDDPASIQSARDWTRRIIAIGLTIAARIAVLQPET